MIDRDSAGRPEEWGWLDRGRVPGLDGLRGASILVVILSHAGRLPRFPVKLPHKVLITLGEVGVDVFFAVSGFLITLLLVREARTTGRIAIGSFYLRRALRILPAFFAYLIFVGLLANLGVVRMRPTDWAHALTYTANFARSPALVIEHVWSLSIEEHFYLLWPPILCGLGFRRARWALLGILLAEPLIRFVVAHQGGSSTQLQRPTFVHLDTIAGGCALALAVSTPGMRKRLARLGRWADLWAAMAFALFLAVRALILLGPVDLIVMFMPTLRAGLIAALILASVARRDSWTARVVNGRILVLVGTLSYSLYLWQQPFLTQAAIDPGRLGTWPMNLLYAGLAATLSYRLIEGPFLRLKDRIGRPKRAGLRTPKTELAVARPVHLGS